MRLLLAFFTALLLFLTSSADTRAPIQDNQVITVLEQNYHDVDYESQLNFEVSEVTYIGNIEDIILYDVPVRTMGFSLSTLIQDESPEVSYGDALNIPSKETPLADKIYWLVGLIVLVLYEVVFRLVPTSKSVSIIAVIYKILNLILKDKKSGGGVFDVVQKE